MNKPPQRHVEYDRTGEIQLVDGKRSMCLGWLYSSWGSSEPWATESEPAVVQLKNQLFRGFLYCLCTRVDPVEKTVELEILRGARWGDLVPGSRHIIPIANIHRYFVNDTAQALVTATHRRRIALRQDETVFENLVADLTEELKGEAEAQLTELLGAGTLAACRSVFRNWETIRKAVRHNGQRELLHPSKPVRVAVRRIRESTRELELPKKDT